MDLPRSDPDEKDEFARMMEESLAPTFHQEGETVQGTIVAIGAEVAFVDIGGKGEATIDVEELADPDSEVQVKVGDTVQAVVVSTVGGLKLSHKLARGAVTRQRLNDAFRAGLPVEGHVEKAIKGGYEVRIGGQRAFCPISQIDTRFTDDPAVHVGQGYTFRIVEFKEDGKDIVVSRRAFLKDEESEKAEAIRRAVVPGADLPGRVASVMAYGAFVDLGGGVQGLLHVSEMGWSRVENPADVVRPGDAITVRVLRVDDDGRKISLGLKQLQADPWSTVAGKYQTGQALKGKVTRIADFGVFVELEPGIEALAHVSAFAPTGKRDGWKAAVPPGATVAVEILSIDPEKKRIGVAVLEAGSVRAQGATGHAAESQAPQPQPRVEIVAGARLTGKVERIEKYGVFVFLAPGRTGLIHLSETGVDRGGDLRKAFPLGSEVEVIVLEVDPAGRRIQLSRKAVLEAGEKSEVREYAAQQDQAQAEGFGSLADKLRAAMRPSKK
ncbi:MAG TPA: S1 RNA-binding domain-containing protein [Candidatus Polarisedimenticolia bacterium]|jgi:small subunit ribosomal protein S1|nr:S1 RNA-binding domain-containing protein [Candidatus Polarisedimenticolia bacterium]